MCSSGNKFQNTYKRTRVVFEERREPYSLAAAQGHRGKGRLSHLLSGDQEIATSNDVVGDCFPASSKNNRQESGKSKEVIVDVRIQGSY